MARRTLIPERHARIVVTVDDAKLAGKAVEPGSSDPGEMEGYASTWGNLDLDNHTMVKGCFARSIKEAVPAGKIKLMARHYRDGGDAVECIGTVVEAREDDHGLWIRAIFSATALAQDIRTKIVEKHVQCLSVGFIPLRWDVRNEEDEKTGEVVQVVAHREARLCEVTATCKPVNELAEITSAKSMPPEKAAPPRIAGAVQAPFDSARARHEIAQRRRRLSLHGAE